MIDDLKNVPNKFQLEQFDISTFSKDKIRDLFRSGKVPTAEVMVDELLLRAAKEGATELHIEPTETELRIRLGFEGVMKKLISLPKEISENLANVFKNRGNLNAFEKKKPQEGRFSFTVAAIQFDARINVLPVMSGERLALRIFQHHTHVASLQELGFSTETLEQIKALMRRPSGLVLFTGPPAGGKSSTVYAAMGAAQSPEKSIMTVENPVEFRIDYAAQVALAPGQGFNVIDALQACLRQNPNIIMISEIRDAEMANAAAEAALTGSLIISSLLAGEAIGAIYRLLNLGASPYLLSSSLAGVVYQQLVRTICLSCKEEYQPASDEHGQFVNIISGTTKFFRGKGCEKCGGSGYQGRAAIGEVLLINDQMRDLIYQQAPSSKMKEAALAAGFENIFQDALKKLSAGETTIHELRRAVG